MREFLGRVWLILGSAGCQPAVVGSLPTTKMMAAKYYVNEIVSGRLPALPAVERMSI